MIDEIFQSKLDIADSTDPIVVSQQTKEEESKAKVKVKNFIQELLTTFSPPLKPGYGTTLIEDLGEVINPPKFSFYLEKNANKIADKYGITKIEVSNIDKSGPMLIGQLIVYIDGLKYPEEFQIDWSNKHFTTQALVE